MPIKTHLTLIMLLVAITLAVYCNSFSNSFAYDDYAFVVNNPSIRQLNLKNLTYYFTDKFTASADRELSGDNWRPLVTASFALDYKLWKLEPAFYHIENTALHVVNAILVYIIAAFILGSPLGGFLAALVFAVHPAQTEAVTWISGRSNLLFMLFFLSAFLLHIKDRKAVPGTINYYLLLIAFTLGLFSKEMAITLPVILIVYDLSFHLGKKLKHYISYYMPFLFISVSYLVVRFLVLGSIAQQTLRWGGSVPRDALLMLKSLAEYIRLLILPVGLGIEYAADIPRSILDKGFLVYAAVLFAVFLMWFRLHRGRKFSFYMAWFFIALIPVSNIIPLKAVMAERFLYLPMVAFGSLFAIFFLNIAGRCKRLPAKALLIFSIAAIFIFYAFGTISRNGQWKNELTLYSKEVLRLPLSPRSHYNLAFVYTKAARLSPSKKISGEYYTKAIKEYGEVLRLKPEYHLTYFAYTGLADIYNETGRYNRAVESFKKAKAIRQGRNSFNNMAVSYFQNRDYGKAITCCRKAILQDPGDITAYVNLGSIYVVIDERAKAKRAYFKAARLSGGDPKLIKTINNL